MEWINYIIDYWAQIVILIAVVGYILKINLDYNFKRKEISYTLYAQKKMDYILEYLRLSYTVESKTLGIISVLKRGVITDLTKQKDLDILDLVNLKTETGRALNFLDLFVKIKRIHKL